MSPTIFNITLSSNTADHKNIRTYIYVANMMSKVHSFQQDGESVYICIIHILIVE